MRLKANWITENGAQAILKMFEKAGYKSYFVGGCVRNTILKHPVTDVDIATDATPIITMQLAEQTGLKALPTGIDHGTVTLVAQHQPYEVTTFRKDIKTDGRHAQVQFSKDIVADAKRRDFTMNALYADANGQVIDPLSGLDDLIKGHIRFIDEAEARISEDSLRILRFFRLSAFYAVTDHGFDPDALSAIGKNLDCLSSLSKDRIGAEMRKLLAAPNPVPSIAKMNDIGVLAKVLPGCDNTSLARVIHLESIYKLQADPMRRLASIGGDDAPAALRLSNAEAKTLSILRKHMGTNLKAGELGYHFGKNLSQSILLLRAAEFAVALDHKDLLAANVGSTAICPVKGKDLLNSYSGEALGKKLLELESRWIASEFKLSRYDLLN